MCSERVGRDTHLDKVDEADPFISTNCPLEETLIDLVGVVGDLRHVVACGGVRVPCGVSGAVKKMQCDVSGEFCASCDGEWL